MFQLSYKFFVTYLYTPTIFKKPLSDVTVIVMLKCNKMVIKLTI